MLKKLVLVVLLVLILALPAFASVGVKQDGTMQGTATDLNIIGAYVSSDGSTIAIAPGYPVVKTTADTITIADSGRTIIITPISASGGIFTLPAATVGQVYTFVDGKASGTTTFSVDPYSTEIIRFSISGTALDAGDKITSPGQIGDSVTLRCGVTGEWIIGNMKGSWADGS